MGSESEDFWKKIFAFHSPDVGEYLNDLLLEPDALLMGRVTYEGFADVWPERQGEMADRVASRTLTEPLRWNCQLLKGDVAEEIGKLKQEPGGSLLQYGIGELTQTMLKHGLVDEIRLLVFPFSFGEGHRIFDRMGVHTMTLLETKTFDSGVVAHHYKCS
jgi:dihydrofolate reductase